MKELRELKEQKKNTKEEVVGEGLEAGLGAGSEVEVEAEVEAEVDMKYWRNMMSITKKSMTIPLEYGDHHLQIIMMMMMSMIYTTGM